MRSPQELQLWIIGLGAVAVAALIAGYLVSRIIRRRLQSDHQVEPFTLQDLRDLRSSGQITEQEYASMRAALLGRYEEAMRQPDPGDRNEVEQDEGKNAR